MTIYGIIFDLGSTLMYFDGEWEDAINQGAADMAAFFTRKRVKLDEGTLAETFIAERRSGREVAYRTDREVTCAESLRATLEKIEAQMRESFNDYKLINRVLDFGDDVETNVYVVKPGRNTNAGDVEEKLKQIAGIEALSMYQSDQHAPF